MKVRKKIEGPSHVKDLHIENKTTDSLYVLN